MKKFDENYPEKILILAKISRINRTTSASTICGMKCCLYFRSILVEAKYVIAKMISNKVKTRIPQKSSVKHKLGAI